MKALAIKNYGNAREFLVDVLAHRKAETPGFSVSAWAKELNLPFPGHLSNVINGRRRMSDELAEKIADNLKLEVDQRRFFTLLNRYGNARGHGEKALLREVIEAINPGTRFDCIELDRFKVCSDWYYVPIIELTKVSGFRPDGAYIARKLGMRISPIQADLALERLKSLGLLKADRRGRLRASHEGKVFIGNHEANEAIRTYHRQTMTESMHAIGNLPVQDRQLSATTIAVKKKDFEALQALVAEFHQRIHAYSCEEEADDVVRLHTQLVRVNR